MTDNDHSYRPGDFNAMLGARGDRAQVCQTLQHLAKRSGRADEPDPRSGMATRASAGGEAKGTGALPAFIERYNWDQSHSACHGMPAMSHTLDVSNVLTHSI